MKIIFTVLCGILVFQSVQVFAQDQPLTFDCRYDVQWNRPAQNDKRIESGKTIRYSLNNGRFWDFSGDTWQDIYEITDKSFILEETHDYLSGSIEGTITAIDRRSGDLSKEVTTCYEPADCMTELWYNGLCEQIDYVDPDAAN